MLAKTCIRDGSRLAGMSRPVTRSQRSLESVRANRGSLGQGQIGNSEVHEREVEQVLEKESDSHEVVRSQVSPELGVSNLIGDLGRAAMANQGPPRGGPKWSERKFGRPTSGCTRWWSC